jgi:hypothetical protein
MHSSTRLEGSGSVVQVQRVSLNVAGLAWQPRPRLHQQHYVCALWVASCPGQPSARSNSMLLHPPGRVSSSQQLPGIFRLVVLACEDEFGSA